MARAQALCLDLLELASVLDGANAELEPTSAPSGREWPTRSLLEDLLDQTQSQRGVIEMGQDITSFFPWRGRFPSIHSIGPSLTELTADSDLGVSRLTFQDLDSACAGSTNAVPRHLSLQPPPDGISHPRSVPRAPHSRPLGFPGSFTPTTNLKVGPSPSLKRSFQVEHIEPDMPSTHRPRPYALGILRRLAAALLSARGVYTPSNPQRHSTTTHQRPPRNKDDFSSRRSA